MKSLLYFAYGSNMSTPRLIARTPSAKALFVARLDNHKLQFHKRSHDGSGKCDIEITNNPVDVVHGVIFELILSEKIILDKIEGLGNGYDEMTVSVSTHQGESITAVCYSATDIDPSLKPYHWYKEHVLRGAREHGLPGEYIQAIGAVESIADPEPENHEKELLIYR